MNLNITSNPSTYLEEGSFRDLVDLEQIASVVQEFRKRNYIPTSPQRLREKFPVGEIFKAKILNVKDYGLFLEIEENVIGMLSADSLASVAEGNHIISEFDRGDVIEVRIIDFNERYNKFDVEFVSTVK